VQWSVVALLLGACGTQPNSVREDEFAGALAEAICTNIGPCCEKSQIGHVGPSCADQVRRIWSPDLQRARKAHLVYDARAAARCVAESREQVVACQTFKEFVDEPTPSCADVYRGGKVALGDECASPWDCAESSAGRVSCHYSLREERLFCAIRETVGIGEKPEARSETHTYSECESSLIQDSDGYCRERPKLGEPCTGFNDPCEFGAVCDGLNTEKCVVPLPTGSACDDSLQCEGFWCNEGRCTEPIGGIGMYCEP
jgi:hypothetical protein